MKRRIDLASALIHLPPILFLDEPTKGLDPRSRVAIWETLERLNAALRMTVVLTTHYMEEADRLCGQMGIIDRGRIIIEGTPAELKTSVGGQTLSLRYAHESSPGALARVRTSLLEPQGACRGRDRRRPVGRRRGRSHGGARAAAPPRTRRDGSASALDQAAHARGRLPPLHRKERRRDRPSPSRHGRKEEHMNALSSIQPEVAVWLLRVAPPAYDRADGNRTEVVMGRGTLTGLWSRRSP